METISLLSKADRMLGRLDMFSEHVPNVNLFIAMHIVKEATQSTRIEGTQRRSESDIARKKFLWTKGTTGTGAELHPGNEFRNPKTRHAASVIKADSRSTLHPHAGSTRRIQAARRIPDGAELDRRTAYRMLFSFSIAPDVPELMSDIEKFIHNSRIMVPDLIKIAIIHYQFETIHPFNDGNGRVGRLLITLYLVSKGLLRSLSCIFPTILKETGMPTTQRS